MLIYSAAQHWVRRKEFITNKREENLATTQSLFVNVDYNTAVQMLCCECFYAAPRQFIWKCHTRGQKGWISAYKAGLCSLFGHVRTLLFSCVWFIILYNFSSHLCLCNQQLCCLILTPPSTIIAEVLSGKPLNPTTQTHKTLYWKLKCCNDYVVDMKNVQICMPKPQKGFSWYSTFTL